MSTCHNRIITVGQRAYATGTVGQRAYATGTLSRSQSTLLCSHHLPPVAILIPESMTDSNSNSRFSQFKSSTFVIGMARVDLESVNMKVLSKTGFIIVLSGIRIGNISAYGNHLYSGASKVQLYTEKIQEILNNIINLRFTGSLGFL